MNYFSANKCLWHCPVANFLLSLHTAVVSEWLRSQTRNLMGYARTGSNPVACETFFVFFVETNLETLAE